MESKILKLIEKYDVEIELKYKKDSIVAIIYGDDVKVIKCGFIKNLIDEIEKECKIIHKNKLKKDSELTERLNNIDVNIFPDYLFKTKNSKKEKYLPLGSCGYVGAYLDPSENKKSEEINKLANEYNSKINTFDTKKENDDFAENIISKINKILKTIK